jgi:hypothetical protein
MLVDIGGQAQKGPVSRCGVEAGGCRNRSSTLIVDSQLSCVADLSFRVTLKMNIRGLVGKPTVSRLATDLECPFELPSNSV